MNSKKWSISILTIVLSIVLLFGALTYCLDPLLQYGKERGFLSFYTYTEIYGNPGIAKNYKYNAVFLGSSMVENADVSEIDSLFGCKTVKLPYSAGTSYNHKHILDVCYQTENTIDIVFWALDEYAFTTEKNTPRYPLPEYLYDKDITNDLSYLLNLDIFYFYISKDILGTLKNQTNNLMKDGAWINDSVYNKTAALQSIQYPLKKTESLGKDYYKDKLIDNLQYNVLPIVQQNPETEFYFYMVPYSISYWYMRNQNGTLESEINIARTVAEELLKYDNVKFFFFQDEEEIITNLDNYKDYSHYKPAINSYMSKQMALGEKKLTKENYQQRIDAFYNYLIEFDYDSFYEEQFK